MSAKSIVFRKRWQENGSLQNTFWQYGNIQNFGTCNFCLSAYRARQYKKNDIFYEWLEEDILSLLFFEKDLIQFILEKPVNQNCFFK